MTAPGEGDEPVMVTGALGKRKGNGQTVAGGLGPEEAGPGFLGSSDLGGVVGTPLGR